MQLKLSRFIVGEVIVQASNWRETIRAPTDKILCATSLLLISLCTNKCNAMHVFSWGCPKTRSSKFISALSVIPGVWRCVSLENCCQQLCLPHGQTLSWARSLLLGTNYVHPNDTQLILFGRCSICVVGNQLCNWRSWTHNCLLSLKTLHVLSEILLRGI